MEEISTYRKHPSCQLYHWGVDVLKGTGPISRGIIRDWIPRKALTVDFLYPGHEEIHVPLRKVIGTSCWHRGRYATGDAVETIVQRSSDQPWRWYPSTVLATDTGVSYAFVEIHYGDGLVRELMPPDRVRLPSGPPFKACVYCRLPMQVLTGIYALKSLHRHTVALPDKDGSALLAVTRKDGFLRIWEREAGVTGAKFKDGRLQYVSYSRTPITEGFMKKYLRRICGLYQALDASDHSVSEPGLMDLPLVLIGEVLSFLDVNTQTMCRRVCRRAWDSFPPKGRLVHIDLTKYSGTVHLKLVATILKTITSSTKTLVLSGTNMESNRGLVQAAHMLTVMGSRIATLILVQQQRDPLDAVEDPPSAEQWDCSALAHVGQELLWLQAVHGSHSRVFRFKEGDGEVAGNRWMAAGQRKYPFVAEF